MPVLFNFIKKFIMLILYIGLSFLAGAVLAFLVMKGRAANLKALLLEQISKLDKDAGILQERLLLAQAENQKLLQELGLERQVSGDLAIHAWQGRKQIIKTSRKN